MRLPFDPAAEQSVFPLISEGRADRQSSRRMLGLILILGLTGIARSETPQQVLAVVDLETRGVGREEMRKTATALSELLRRDPRFMVMEGELVEAILVGQGFSRTTTCANEQCWVGIGHLLTTNKVVGGSISRGPLGTEIAVAMVDVASAQVVARAHEGPWPGESAIGESALATIVDTVLAQYSAWEDSAATAASDKGGGPENGTQTKAVTPGRRRVANLLWLSGGAVVAGAGALAYFVLSRSDDAATGDKGDSGKDGTPADIPIDDAPVRSRY